MRSMSAEIQAQLRALGVEDKLYRLGRAHAARRALQHQLDEVQQRIPLWDRVVFFSDTPDEREARRLKNELERLDAQLHTLREEADTAMAEVAAAWPVYAIAREIDLVTRLIHEHLRVEGVLFKDVTLPQTLFDTLASLAERTANTWVLGFHLEEIIRTLSDEARCRELAHLDLPRLESDPRLGHAPITQQHLLTLLAAHTASGPYFQRLHEAQQQREHLQRLIAQHEDAREAVTFWEKLNVFSDAPSEQLRDDLKRQLPLALDHLRHLNEEAHHVLEASLTAFPPLLILHHASELRGALQTTLKAEERNLNADGAVSTEQLPSSRALVYAALGRLKRGFARAFPGVPLPADVEARAHREAALQSPSPLASAHLLDDFTRAMERVGGEDALERCLRRVTLRQRLGDRLQGLRGAISLWDRVNFDDTEDQRTEAQLHARRQWLDKATHAGWEDLLQTARQAGASIPPLALRDWAVASSLHLQAVHTDKGSTSSPRTCTVYGRQEVYQALDAIAQLLQQTWDLRGDRQELIAALQRRLQHPLPQQPPQRPRTWDDTLDLLASRLLGTPFFDDAAQIDRLAPQLHAAQSELTATRGRITFWDKLNVFTDTPDERRRDELEDALNQLNAQLRPHVERLNATLEAALNAWPPAALYFSVGQVHTAVAAIRAVCQSYTVTTGSGNSRRTETRYRCVLYGLGHAFAQQRAWNARYVALFGPQPGYNELLARWSPATHG